MINTAPSFCFANVCRDLSVLDKNRDYTKLKGDVGDMNPKVTRSSLEMLLVNTFRNITKEESDPLPGHIFISYMATALMLNIHREREFQIFSFLFVK